MSDIMMTSVRLPRWLHGAAEAAAAATGQSLNKFMVAAITHATTAATPAAKPTSDGVTYEVTLRFEAAADQGDEVAYEVLDRVKGAAETAGAFAVFADVARLAAMTPRT